jgi:hypothetical protein
VFGVLWCWQAAWLVKCKAVIRQNYIDDIELDEESVADIVMDENAVASMPRCVIDGPIYLTHSFASLIHSPTTFIHAHVHCIDVYVNVFLGPVLH